MVEEWLHEALGLREPDRAFPWQEALLQRFIQGRIPGAIDIPTGLGKTAVMAIWLVARAKGAPVPRRLVYVVDRRAIVDQATDVAEGLREFVAGRPEVGAGLGLAPAQELPISTLRGQYVDNRKWLTDPSLPAVVVGTVDMIGSRVLFSGYGVSRRMRPYHAGLLGADALIVLDESHLVAPFVHLMRFVVGDPSLRPSTTTSGLVPAAKLICLSATVGGTQEEPFGLQPKDLGDGQVQKRLGAVKRLTVRDIGERKLADELAAEAWRLAAEGTAAVRCLVCADRRDTVQQAQRRLQDLGKKAGRRVETELLVGGRRVFERGQARRRLVELGFLLPAPGEHAPPIAEGPVFLLATSAGEVGIDLDADRLACDLVTWERMVQRFGRVNRRGLRDGRVTLVLEGQPAGLAAARALAPKDRKAKHLDLLRVADLREAVLDILAQLDAGMGESDVSPGALRSLALAARADGALARRLAEAAAPEVLRPPVSRALIDAWSLTSLPDHPGRPVVGPWVRGWVRDEPETEVVWRRHVPPSDGPEDAATKRRAAAYFEAVPPHFSEILQTQSYRVAEWLVERAKVASARTRVDDSQAWLGQSEVAAWILGPDGQEIEALPLRDLNTPEVEAKLAKRLPGATVVVDARLGGLEHGLLANSGETDIPRVADDGEEWMLEGTVGFRVRTEEADLPDDGPWHERARFPTRWSDEGEPDAWLFVDRWRGDSATEDDRSAQGWQELGEHQSAVRAAALAISERLGLPAEYRELLGLVARHHDQGKAAPRWQRAFRAREDRVYAKTPGPINAALLDGYRHEFGSLGQALQEGWFDNHPDDLRDLALHLLAAHHGYARPAMPVSGCDDAPPSALGRRAAAVALRFASLQARWGPYGLAWCEALLRAADQQASSARTSDGTEGG